MSHEAVQAVLERTLADETFRAQLFSSPDEALAPYDLTPSESSALRTLCEETEAGESAALDRRQSKKPLWLLGL